MIVKTHHNFRVIRKDGKQYDLAQLGVIVTKFIVSAPEVRHETEEMEGRDGLVDLGTMYGSRSIEAQCEMKARDIYDYPLLRNELFRVFDSREPFYVVCDLEPGKRWLVKYAGTYSMAQIATLGKFTLPLVSFSPYSESTTTTLDPLIFESEAWQFGHGIPLEDVRYDHSNRKFRIYNMGDVTVDPREHPLHITIHTTATDQTTLEMINHTTGDHFKYTGNTYNTIPIELIGVRVWRGQRTSLLRRTNYGLITLAPGWNELEVRGAEFSRITFDFRFYYF
ncbi:phage tail family protein [Desmospora activa]|nr:phage tail family protein [Desmospora activa]